LENTQRKSAYGLAGQTLGADCHQFLSSQDEQETNQEPTEGLTVQETCCNTQCQSTKDEVQNIPQAGGKVQANGTQSQYDNAPEENRGILWTKENTKQDNGAKSDQKS